MSIEDVLPIGWQDNTLIPLPRQAHSEGVADGDRDTNLGSRRLRHLRLDSGQLMHEFRRMPLSRILGPSHAFSCPRPPAADGRTESYGTGKTAQNALQRARQWNAVGHLLSLWPLLPIPGQ